MKHVPVGRSIAHAYGFLFGGIVTVVSLSWVAAVFFAALRRAMFAMDPVVMPLAAHPQAALVHAAAFVGALLLICAVAVPLTRTALGERPEWTLAHFVIGGRELRLFLALIRLYLILIAVIALCVLGVAGAAMGAKAALAQWPAVAKSGVPVEAVARGVSIAIAVIVALYISLRLSFFVYPVAAAEPHASLRRAWSLGGGNVLRILAVVLAIVVPVYALVIAAEYALMGQTLIDTAHRFLTTLPRDMLPLHALLAAHAGAISAGAAVVMVVMTALSAGASAAAYLRVTGADAEVLAVAEALAETAHHDHGEALAGDAAHDDRGHDDHSHDHDGHDGHGQEAHGHHGGHDDHGHAEDAHGAEDHGHAHPAPEEHGQDDHGHDEHAHRDDAHMHAAEEDVVHHDAPQPHDEDVHGDDHGAPGEEPHAHAALPEHQAAPEDGAHELREAEFLPEAGEGAAHAEDDGRPLEHA